jgi:hypothetical protein
VRRLGWDRATNRHLALNGKALCNLTIDARSGAVASFGGVAPAPLRAWAPSTFVMSDTPVDLSRVFSIIRCRTPNGGGFPRKVAATGAASEDSGRALN